MGKVLILVLSVGVGLAILWRLNISAEANADNAPRKRPPPEF